MERRYVLPFAVGGCKKGPINYGGSVQISMLEIYLFQQFLENLHPLLNIHIYLEPILELTEDRSQEIYTRLDVSMSCN